MKVRISDDAVSLACGADAVAAAFEAAGCEVERVSSWGMHWLEPLVEIDGIGYGPVGVEDVDGILKPSPLQGRGFSASAPSLNTLSSPNKPASPLPARVKPVRCHSTIMLQRAAGSVCNRRAA